MNQIKNELKRWREERNLQSNKYDLKTSKANFIEEIQEVEDAINQEEYLFEIADVAIFAFNDLGYLKGAYQKVNVPCYDLEIIEVSVECLGKNRHRNINLLNAIITCCKGLIQEKGYDFKKVVMEKVKKIHSREQDPKQKRDWKKNGASGKWKKHVAQNLDLIYRTNIESCKLK